MVTPRCETTQTESNRRNKLGPTRDKKKETKINLLVNAAKENEYKKN